MIPGMCVAFRAMVATDVHDSLDAQLALALDQQLTAALVMQPYLSDEDFVAWLADRRELMNARRALLRASHRDLPRCRDAGRDNVLDLHGQRVAAPIARAAGLGAQARARPVG